MVSTRDALGAVPTGESGRFGRALLAGAGLHALLALVLARHGHEVVRPLDARAPLQADLIELAETVGDQGRGGVAAGHPADDAPHHAAHGAVRAHGPAVRSPSTAPVAAAAATQASMGPVGAGESSLVPGEGSEQGEGAVRGGGQGDGQAVGAGASGGGRADRQVAALVAAPSCDAFFPYAAPEDVGVVAVAVTVTPAGDPGAVVVESESPSGAGFAGAAKSCVSYARFRPARDLAGAAVASIAHLQLKFSRHH